MDRYVHLAMIDSRVALALAAHDKLWHDVVGGALAAERKRFRSLVADEVAKLRAEFDLRIAGLLAEIDKRGLGGDRGEIIDLPAMPLRRSRDAA